MDSTQVSGTWYSSSILDETTLTFILESNESLITRIKSWFCTGFLFVGATRTDMDLPAYTNAAREHEGSKALIIILLPPSSETLAAIGFDREKVVKKRTWAIETIFG